MSDAPKPEQVFSRIINHADKLSASLDELEAAGGLRALAREMRPGSIDRLAASLREIRAAIDVQLAGLKGPKPKPRPGSVPAPPRPPESTPDPPASRADEAPIRRSGADRAG